GCAPVEMPHDGGVGQSDSDVPGCASAEMPSGVEGIGVFRGMLTWAVCNAWLLGALALALLIGEMPKILAACCAPPGATGLGTAVWRFCRAFTRTESAARWAFCLALFASGFELFAALIGGYSGNWSYEMNGFGLLFAAPHVPLAMAATLELARDALRPARRI